MLQFRQMEVFRAMMLTGSVKGAASLMRLSPSAVSRMVAQLECDVGYPLFERVKGRLAPTGEATALLPEVEACYRHALQLSELAENLRVGSAGTLNICASHCLSRGLVPRAIARFLAQFPKVQVQVRASLLADMPGEVLSNRADLAVSVLPLHHANLQVTPFTEGRMVCVAPPGHALASLPSAQFEDIAAYPVITHHPSIPFGQLVTAAFERAHVHLPSRIHIYHTDVACALVRAGAGVAIVDEFTVDGLAWGGDLSVVPLATGIVLTPAVLRSMLAGGRPHADQFVAALEEEARRDRRGGVAATA
ncbi:LysR family transcriptional regulator [Xanthomonas axonopodis]|uniref:LysR family transcriptional regulator n=1 Tax=Xanthomonas axonopodis TaxID=53413 RepID=UPI003558D4B1